MSENDTSTNKLRVLIVSQRHKKIAVAKLPKALHRAGFSVAAICSDKSFLSNTRYLDAYIRCPENSRRLFSTLRSTIRTWRPDFVLPGDRWSLYFLQRLASSYHVRWRWPQMHDLLHLSLGDPRFFNHMDSKHVLQELARRIGVRAPLNYSVQTLNDVLSKGDACGYPVVLKNEYGEGGRGVKICQNQDELSEAFQELATSGEKRFSPGKLIKTLKHFPHRTKEDKRGHLSLQQYIKGKPALYSFVAENGAILEGFTVLRECPHPPPTGPGCVVRNVRHPQIEASATMIVAHTGFSGFGCFDFMVEEASCDGYLIECNPYPVNVVHLGHMFGADLCAALHARLAKAPAGRTYASERIVALFPQELLRDPNSAYKAMLHDIPYDDPKLLNAFLSHFGIAETTLPPRQRTASS